MEPHKISVTLDSFNPSSKNIVMIDDKKIVASEITIKTAINKPTSVTITMPYCEVQALIKSRLNIEVLPEINLTLDKVETNEKKELVAVFSDIKKVSQETRESLERFQDKIRQKTIPK